MNVTRSVSGSGSACALALAVALVPALPGTAAQGARSGPDCSEVACVALTFDDGPGAHTDDLLDVLDAHGARATFYLLGSRVGAHTDTVERMAREGHQVGNHTWDHPDLTGLSPERIQHQLKRTDEAVGRVVGHKPTTVRPPYGALDRDVRESAGRPLMLWDVDTLDWQSLDPGAVTEEAVEAASEGSVVLFHDIHESTVEAIPDVLEGLEDQGYAFVTVDRLFEGRAMEPGTALTDAR